MTKGIRDFAYQRFRALLPQVDELGATGFRRAVMEDIQNEFDVKVASAATAYNHVLKLMREEAPAQVEGIGRGPDDRRGKVIDPQHDSRLKGNEVLRPTDPDRAKQAAGGRKGGRGGRGSTEGRGRVQNPERDARLKVAPEPRKQATKTPAPPPEAPRAVDVVTVIKVRDGEVVAELPRRLAKDLVAASSQRGRAKLVIREDRPNGN